MDWTFSHVDSSGSARNPSANILICLFLRIFFSAPPMKRLVRLASQSSSSSFSLSACHCWHPRDFCFGLLSCWALALVAWWLIWEGISNWIGEWSFRLISLIHFCCFCHCRRAGMLGLSCFCPNRFFKTWSWEIEFLFSFCWLPLFSIPRSLPWLGWGVPPPCPLPFWHLCLLVLVFQSSCFLLTHSPFFAHNFFYRANSTILWWWLWWWAWGWYQSRCWAACLGQSTLNPYFQRWCRWGIRRLLRGR